MSPGNEREGAGGAATASATRRGRSILSGAQWQALAERLALSARELQTVQAIFDDQTEAAIGRSLGISSHTVHTHLERLYRKLDVDCRCAAVVRVFAEYVALESQMRR